MKTPFRKLCVIALAVLFSIPACAESGPSQKARLLIFGNSFSGDSTSHLLELAKEGNKDLVFLNLMKGGCSLKEHTEAVKAALTDPESNQARFYKHGGNVPSPAPAGKKVNALEAIQAAPWDYVSIHQYSLHSFKPETYEPYAKELVDFLRSKLPGAKIIVHQSWAYREDDPLFGDGIFTSDKMHAALKAAYTKMAMDYQLRIVPIGDAFQAARKTPEWTYVKDAAFDFQNPKPGTYPNQQGSLNTGWIWTKPTANTATPDTGPASDPNAAKDTSAKLILDAHHANVAGDYLGSCVWYEFLFNDDVTALTKYKPRTLTAEQAASLRKIAHETVVKQGEAEAAAAVR